jgi:hypothetical protein
VGGVLPDAANSTVGSTWHPLPRGAQLFGIFQPHVSELKPYKLNRFSSERLLRFVTLLDRDASLPLTLILN